MLKSCLLTDTISYPIHHITEPGLQSIMLKSKPVQNFLSCVALMNTMIGSAILLLPILYFKAGILTSILLMTCSGFFSFFSAMLCLDHVNQKQNYFKDSINRHMGKKIFPLYEICCFVSKQIIFYLYFSIIMKQWKGILFEHQNVIFWMEFGTLVSLILITLFLRKVEMGVSVMALGMLSTLFYCAFLGEKFARIGSRSQTFPVVTSLKPVPDLLGLLATAFSTQNVFVQILRKNPHQDSYKKIIIGAYSCGYLIYLFIGVIGGLTFLNMKPINENNQTIMDYFEADSADVIILYILYLIHLYSVWPEWMNVNGRRLVTLLGYAPTELNTMIHAIVSPCIGYGFYKLEVNLSTFIDINGGVCLFFIIYAFPIFIHLKCRYFTSPQQLASHALPPQQNSNMDDQQKQESKDPLVDQEGQFDPHKICNENREKLQDNSKYKLWKIGTFTFLAIMTGYGLMVLVVILWKTFRH